MLLQFPRRVHPARASVKTGPSARSGAVISLASTSSVTPPVLPTSDIVTGNHQSAGMRSRCDHLRTAVAGAPISDAMASHETHKPTTSRKDVGVAMLPFLGQSVLKSKPNVSHDRHQSQGLKCPMDSDAGKSVYKQRFIARTRAARAARFEHQQELCTALNIDQGTYKQYETRSLLPHWLIPRFCAACAVDIKWLFTAKGKGVPMTAPAPVKRGRKPVTRKVA